MEDFETACRNWCEWSTRKSRVSQSGQKMQIGEELDVPAEAGADLSDIQHKITQERSYRNVGMVVGESARIVHVGGRCMVQALVTQSSCIVGLIFG